MIKYIDKYVTNIIPNNGGPKDRENCWYRAFKTNKARKLLELMYKDCNVYLDRKYKFYLDSIKNKNEVM